MLYHNDNHVEDPVEYNRKINEFRAKPGHHGCISTRACEECGVLVSDSICLCIGAFDCPKRPFNFDVTGTPIEFKGPRWMGDGIIKFGEKNNQ